jgi:ergothioneine biosynthesis protein EgtB
MVRTLLSSSTEALDALSARQALADSYQQVRQATETLCAPLAVEDYVIQSMPDCSPTKWHLAHVSWFFETFLLKPSSDGYQALDPRYAYLFNSYYNAAGDKYPRPQRGLVSRPTVSEVYAFRRHVDEHVLDLLECASDSALGEIAPIVVLGLNHEQQHQELIVTDLKHMFSHNPLHPEYSGRVAGGDASAALAKMEWVDFAEGIYWIGHEGDGFAFDNESMRHRVFLNAFRLASRLVTNAEFMEFMRDGGYERPEFWLSMGWATVQQERWQAPLYWQQDDDGAWWQYTLSGLRRVELGEPVSHVSYFEADAYARWAGARLPTEAEWESAAVTAPIEGNFVESGRFHAAPATAGQGLQQMYGDLWEWTQSSYSPYPGFKIAPGALGEYNGKFMCNQYVLRGGSCATPRSHIRPTYRNFFPPDARWQFSGLRLANDA